MGQNQWKFKKTFIDLSFGSLYNKMDVIAHIGIILKSGVFQKSPGNK